MIHPATIDGSSIPADAPRAQGMTDPTAVALSDAADEYRSNVFHIRADTTGSDAVLTVTNCPEGKVLIVFGDGSSDVEIDSGGPGASATAQHTYLSDGVFLAQALIATDRAFCEVVINWPPYAAEEPPA